MVQLIVWINQQATNAIPACSNLQSQSPLQSSNAQKAGETGQQSALQLECHEHVKHQQKTGMLAKHSKCTTL